jgi:haloacid dehalogenase-like hydrolase
MVDKESLPSWNDGETKSAIVDFVARVTKQGGPEFVPAAERIATFDNDGTLWCEQPLQIQFFFAFDRVKQLSAKNPTMSERQPFKAVLESDYNTLFGLGKQALFELAFATHAGITDEDFDQVASGWLATARHPKFGRLFKECTYRPQVELLAYLRENGFKTYIVSAGGRGFHARLRGGSLRHPTRASDRFQRETALRLERQQGFAREAAGAQQLWRSGSEGAEYRPTYRP